MLAHGGSLLRAARELGIAPAMWLDLSTGINPGGWPVPEIPSRFWQRLPEDDDDLLPAARQYYQCETLLPVAGSQAAIQLLPRLRHQLHGRARVGVVLPAYQEHRHCWALEGHEVIAIAADRIDEQLDRLDVLLLINPNNPDGRTWPVQQLLQWQQRLAARQGWLLVDEAFMDVTPQHSLLPHCPRQGLIVLRSLGKFFGLAGARVGFVAALPALLQQLQEQLGPWSVCAASRYLAALALRDEDWQQRNRQHLLQEGRRLRALLTGAGLRPDGGCALFQWLLCDDAPALYEAFARRGILLRRFEEPPSLRFGLPGDKAGWLRLEQALNEISATHLAKERRA